MTKGSSPFAMTDTCFKWVRGVKLSPNKNQQQKLVAAILGCFSAADVFAWSLTIDPRIGVSETYTDNMASQVAVPAKSGFVTSISPSIRIDGKGARVKGFFDLRWNESIYPSESDLNHNEKDLNSLATIEAIENFLFVDTTAIITQQKKSAFGPNSVTSVDNGNRSEVTVLQVSPYIRGQISDVAIYQLRFNATGARSNDGSLPKTETSEWLGSLKSSPSFAMLAWSLDANSLSVRNDTVGSRDDSRVLGSLIYQFDPQLHFSVSDGQESTNFGASRQTISTPGVGMVWAPSERTQLAATKGKRFFGYGHSVLFSHRMHYIAWRYTDEKESEILPNQIAGTGLGAIPGLMSDLLAASIPDPDERAIAVRERLQQSGAANGALTSDFTASNIYVSRKREASMALLGTINTFTLSFNEEESSGINIGPSAVGSFAVSGDIRQQGFNFSWAHRLSPVSALTTSASRINSEGLSVTNLESTQTEQTVTWSRQLSKISTAALAYRHVQFNSNAGGYRENAVVVSASTRF